MTAPRIAALIPSRGRPGNIVRLSNAIQATADSTIDVHVRVDDDDPALEAYQALAHDQPDGYPNVTVTVGPRIRLAASWNEQAAVYAHRYDLLALWGDDVIPQTPGWDTLLSVPLRDATGWAYGRDGVWDHTYDRQVPGHLLLPTATLMRADLAAALGWVAPPGLTHLCIDVAWRDLGIAAGCLHYVPRVMIEHLHPCRGVVPQDDVYRDANSATRKREDNQAYRAWREGPGFLAALEVVKAAAVGETITA